MGSCSTYIFRNSALDAAGKWPPSSRAVPHWAGFPQTHAGSCGARTTPFSCGLTSRTDCLLERTFHLPLEPGSNCKRSLRRTGPQASVSPRPQSCEDSGHVLCRAPLCPGATSSLQASLVFPSPVPVPAAWEENLTPP